MPISIPTTAALPSSQLLPVTHPSVTKTLQRLSRPSLLSLALDWLDERNLDNSAPYLTQEDDEEDAQDLYPPAKSLSQLRETYTELQALKGTKRDIADRILEGDWRHGISLYQLAMADMQYLYDHPSSQKWTALKLVRLSSSTSSSTNASNLEHEPASIPRFHPSTFLRNLRREILPDVKAHYNLDKHPTLPLLILRIYIIDSPYNTSLALAPPLISKSKQNSTTTTSIATTEASRTFYIAFPTASPHIFISLTTTTASTTPSQGSISDNRSLRKLTLEAIPKAFSKPMERYGLESTHLSAKNLEALCERRGGGREGGVGGGWGIYSETGKVDNPLDLELNTKGLEDGNVQLPSPDPTEAEGGAMKEKEVVLGMKRKPVEDSRVVKRRNLVAQGRFGNSARHGDGKGIERLDIRIEDPYPYPSTSKPLFGEIQSQPNEDDDTIIDTKAKKRKGRRSTTDLELAHSAPVDGVDDVEENNEWRPDIRLIFQGQHVFAGIRELAELGIVDGERMPGWMTGEEGVSVGVVRDGRIKGGRGAGL